VGPFAKNIRKKFAGLNKNQKKILLVAVILMLLNITILVLSMTFFVKVLDRIG